MKLAVIHHHLNRGGVTQVIANHLRALDTQMTAPARLPVALLSGGRCEGWQQDLTDELRQLDVTRYTIPELDYDDVRPGSGDLLAQLRSTLQACACPPQETVLHVHNHSLGKNKALIPALTALAREGYALLLQIHDFAEDFRPANYQRLMAATGDERRQPGPSGIYPQASQVHYATLNRRDFDILRDAGVGETQLHLLPNAVGDLGPLPSPHSARAKLAERFGIPGNRKFVLYPVRGIRRKNLGEALLYSALADDQTSFGLTLAPLNPAERTSYSRWTALAERCDLPFVFEAGGPDGLGFLENLAAADLLMTTSVAEGFGLVFLESWLAGRRLIGRELPEITADFCQSGLRYPDMRARLVIPVDWLPAENFRTQFAAAYLSVLKACGQPANDIADRDWDQLIPNGHVDFGQCPTNLQQEVLQRVVASARDRDHLLHVNPWVAEALTSPSDPALIAENAACVRAGYSLASCGHRLMSIHERAVSSVRAPELEPLPHAERILQRFLNPARFHPLLGEV